MDGAATTEAPVKDLYEVGEIPPLGHVPKQMYAWCIRRERHGPPEEAMQVEVVETPEIDSGEVLVFVMAAGVNYNGVWAGLGKPISPFDVHGAPYHIAGSDASGIVWKVGDKVKRWKVGDEVVIAHSSDTEVRVYEGEVESLSSQVRCCGRRLSCCAGTRVNWAKLPAGVS